MADADLPAACHKIPIYWHGITGLTGRVSAIGVGVIIQNEIGAARFPHIWRQRRRSPPLLLL